MNFDQLLERRYSCRSYTETPLSEAEIKELIAAANCAPVGSARYMDLHLTVVQDKELLMKLTEALFIRVEQKKKEMEAIVETVESQKAAPMPRDPYYGAPVMIFISHKKQDLQPGIEWCNVMNVAMFIHLKATEMGLGSCFAWGVLESERMFPEYSHNELLNLPEGFEPLIGILVGHPKEEGKRRNLPVDRLGINYLP
ncbi:MAG: nitroreductase family protein [Parasporobacterium sp.]|nr:nitroreductase family protein [Parasporobacterium sp.]